jgi:hypothetical protein
MRTAEVRYAGTAIDGPFEQHDLSKFCASENHAVKAGAYIVSRRRHITHRTRLGVKPDAYNPTLATGDLVRVTLRRTPSTGATSLHDYLYEVDRIGKSVSGEVLLELTHFPVDANGASVVAQEVAAATGTGLLLPTGLTGTTCDVNSSADTSVPVETFTEETFPDYGSEIDETSEAAPGDAQENPEDDLAGQADGPFADYPVPGNPNVPPFPVTPAPLTPILMPEGNSAPGGRIPGPHDWAPGSYSSTLTLSSGTVGSYSKVSGGCVLATDTRPSGTATISGFVYGLYRYDIPGECGGSASYGWWCLRAVPGFMPVWYSLASGGISAGAIDLRSWTIANTFVPV